MAIFTHLNQNKHARKSIFINQFLIYLMIYYHFSPLNDLLPITMYFK